LAKAERVYRDAIAACGSNAVLLYNLGVLLDDMDRKVEAMQAYEAALQGNPGLADCHYNLALICEELKKPKEAIRHMAQYRRLIGTSRDYVPRTFRTFDPPYEGFDNGMLGAQFPSNSTSSVACGFAAGTARDWRLPELLPAARLHRDTRHQLPASLQDPALDGRFVLSTDLFIREVTDSGPSPAAHFERKSARAAAANPAAPRKNQDSCWMQTYFGFSLVENVEKHCAPLSADEKRLHLAYMAKAYRIMGIRFSAKRNDLERFARLIEAEQAR